jgi:molybdate transport system substrate-binding protein
MKLLSSVCTAFILVVVLPNQALSAELTIFGSRATKMIVEDVGPQFERATGHKLIVVTDVAAAIKRTIEAGDPFDLAVLLNSQADELIKNGKLIADTRSDLMRTGIGVAVRRGSLLPDITAVDSFKQTLLSAKSITYLKEGGSTVYLNALFERMGIAEALRQKTIKTDTESVSELVAAGDAEIGIIVIPNILSIPGAQLVGPLPEQIQSYIIFTAAVGANSANQQAARDLITLLKSPAAITSMKSKGMIPE